MKILHMLFFVFLAVAATAADNPYNETADAKAEIKQALTQAAITNTPIIIVFGANWCGDCKMLDSAMKNGASAPLLSRDFKIVKVNVGRCDTNLDVAKTYGVPLDKGIPAVAIISAKNEVLYVTREGELANARKMGDKGIYDFFKRVTTETMTKGLAQFDEVRSVAEAFVLRADTVTYRKHTDFTGVPADTLQHINATLDNWHGVPGTLKLTDTKVMTSTEYETFEQEDNKDIPEDMRSAVLSAIRWNIKPDKVIVFTFRSKDPNDTNTIARWSAGAYQTNGLWYFSAGYKQ